MQTTDVETGRRQVAALREFTGGSALAKLERLVSDARTEPRRALEHFAGGSALAELERLVSDARTERRRALDRFAGGPALAELERLLSDARTEQRQALKRFAADDRLAKVKRLIAEAGAQAARFNLFELLGLASDEERHSRILGWLFDPAQNHGLGEAFLTRFLAATTAEAGKCCISPAAAPTAGWETTVVQLEWANQVDGELGYLDILAVNRQKRFLCAIENKIWATEQSDQLTRYRRALEASYPDYSRHLVFLSPRGAAPYRAEERNFWTPVSYTTVLGALDQTIETQAMPPDVSAFLRQYATTLRMHIVPDSTEINRLARKIYLEHREAIDLIYQHKPDYQGDAKKIIAAALDDLGNWRVDWALNYYNYLRFMPTAWEEFAALLETGNAFRGSKAMLRFDFHLGAVGAGSARLELAIWPGDVPAVRERIAASANDNRAIFNQAPVDFRDGTLILDAREYALDDSDLDHWDSEATRARIAGWVTDFVQTQFPAMNEVIVNCLKEYKAEQDGRAELGQ